MSNLTAFVYLAGSVVCHQLPERSFHLMAVQFPVCARCTGLYLGAIVGLALWLLRGDRTLSYGAARVALAIAAVPTLLTVMTAHAGWWDPVNGLRAAFAAPLGAAIGAVVGAGLTQNLR